jgi:hypothetical protein
LLPLPLLLLLLLLLLLFFGCCSVGFGTALEGGQL